MATPDNAVSIHPYFRINEGHQEQARSLCEQLIERTRQEPGCLYYAFSFSGELMHCREAYEDAAGLAAHLENSGLLIQELLENHASLERLEVHGPKAELDQLREPLAHMSPQFYTLETGFRK